MAAVNCEQGEAVGVLISYGADVNSINEYTGWGPIHLAASIGNEDILLTLLNCGGDKDLLVASGAGAPLHVAAGSGHENLVRHLIIMGADINIQDDCGCAPIHYASQHGHVYVVECLIRAGADINIQQNEGATSLYLAAYFGQAEVAQTLINYGANTALSDTRGYTPLDIAKHCKSWYLIRLLDIAKDDTSVVWDGFKGGHGTWIYYKFQHRKTEMLKLAVDSRYHANNCTHWPHLLHQLLTIRGVIWLWSCAGKLAKVPVRHNSPPCSSHFCPSGHHAALGILIAPCDFESIRFVCEICKQRKYRLMLINDTQPSFFT